MKNLLIQNHSLLIAILLLSGFIYCGCNSKSNDKQNTYNLIDDKDTMPINVQKNLKNGLYILDSSMTLKYLESKNDDPENPQTVIDEHGVFVNNFPTLTNGVNFLPADIGGFYNSLVQAAQCDHKTIDSFRINFIVYDHVPTIRNVPRPEYVGKVSVALVAMSAGREYTTCTNCPTIDIRPRNLGTICPVCQ